KTSVAVPKETRQTDHPLGTEIKRIVSPALERQSKHRAVIADVRGHGEDKRCDKRDSPPALTDTKIERKGKHSSDDRITRMQPRKARDQHVEHEILPHSAESTVDRAY